MIKYAKTKDGKIVKVSLEGDVFTSRYEIVGELKNTIEELCDEFVGVGNIFGNKPIYRHYKYLYEATKLDDIVYAAIWTEKGLIYVAKLNNEGELELI